MSTTYIGTLRSQTCCHSGCGVIFGIEQTYDDILRRSHKSFYCPNGHGQHYSGKSDVELAREDAEQARRQRDYERERNGRLESDLRSERHKVAAERGAKTKLKKRIAHGVCPCCKRTFANVARHMKSKHPEQIKSKA
jgi:hypothetical protein